MSLFVGNISRSARTEDIEKDFKKYGHCRIKFKGSYAFIEFESEKDGEDAIKNLQSKMVGGRELNIEWSKKSGKYDSSKRKRKSTSPRRKDQKEQRCYKCGHRGHFSYDCRDGSSRNRRRSRSDSRHRHRKRSNSKHKKRSRSSSGRKKHSHRKRSPSSKSSSSRSDRKDDKSPIIQRSNDLKDENNKSENKNNEKNGNHHSEKSDTNQKSKD